MLPWTRRQILRTFTLLLMFLPVGAGPRYAQQADSAASAAAPQRASAQEQPIQAVAEEVLLDLVARDRKGRPVVDLKREELQVLEDGTPQQITSFRLIEPGRLPAAAEVAPGVQPDPLRHINLVTLVFERLGVEARQLARRAALDFLQRELGKNMLVAVFTIDQRLYVLQQYTNDRKLLTAAIEEATRGNFTEFAAQSAAIERDLREAAATLASSQANAQVAASSLGRGAGPAPGMGSSFAEAKMAELTVAMLQFSRDLQQEQEGQASIYSLLALVKDQGRLSGRKTVIYFAEGLVVPPNLVEQLRSTISAANRANVSVYGVDARGLFTGGLTESTRQSLLDTAAVSKGQVFSLDGHAVTREEAMLGESAEGTLRKDVQGTLADLATSTGGFLIADTNDFRVGLRHVGEDIRSYYEVAYRPAKQEYDARFRRISVRVFRPGVTLQTRSGYFALPPMPDSPLFPYEMKMLAALSSSPPPREFEFHAAALRYRQEEDGTQLELVIEVPLANFKFVTDKEKRLYRVRFSLLALVKDRQHRVIHKFSQNYPLQGALDQLSTLTKGNVIFTRSFRLPPGAYTLEAVALDREAEKASVRRTSLVVTLPRSGVALSSICFPRRVDPRSGENQDPDSPFNFQQNTITPSLADAVKQGKGSQLLIYLVVYPSKAIAEKPQLSVELFKDGNLLAQTPLELPAPDERGRIAYVASMPLENFPPGQYDLHVVAHQGASSVDESKVLNILP